MSAPAQVTEAHRELLHQLLMNVEHGYLKEAAQFIADSEARAVEASAIRADCLQREVDRWTKWNTEQPWLAEIRGYSQQVASLTSERDQLRAARNSDCEAHYVERDQLRADVEQWELAFQEQFAQAESAEREVERLRSETARIGKNGAEEYIRAERAEAELATERARLDWMELRGPWESWNGFGKTGITLRENIRAAIDAAMKEGAVVYTINGNPSPKCATAIDGMVRLAEVGRNRASDICEHGWPKAYWCNACHMQKFNAAMKEGSK